MSFLRRRLKLYVAAWLVFQSASLSALVTRDCCREHRAMESARTTAAEEEPLCPMHAGAASSAPDSRCVMRGTCDGPLTTLAALLSQQGVLPESTSVAFHLRPMPGAIVVSEPTIERRTPPDNPPPRA